MKVTDFGIARATNAVPLTQTGAIMGTAYYISPEQASGRPVTPASDVYSLGIVAYECLTGRRPFDGDTPVSVALAQVSQEPPALPADLPDPVRELVMRMLAKDPAARPASAGELGAEALALRPVVAVGAHPCACSRLRRPGRCRSSARPTTTPPAPPDLTRTVDRPAVRQRGDDRRRPALEHRHRPRLPAARPLVAAALGAVRRRSGRRRAGAAARRAGLLGRQHRRRLDPDPRRLVVGRRQHRAGHRRRGGGGLPDAARGRRARRPRGARAHRGGHLDGGRRSGRYREGREPDGHARRREPGHDRGRRRAGAQAGHARTSPARARGRRRSTSRGRRSAASSWVVATRSASSSVAAAWPRCTSAATPGSAARSRSRCCGRTSPATRRSRPGSAARRSPPRRSTTRRSSSVYDTGEDEFAGNPVPYIVMEYVEGSTLRDLLGSGNKLVPERALEIVDGVLARSGVQPPAGHRAPRHQAGERHAHHGRRRQGDGLRHRPRHGRHAAPR